ncbi:MAG: hypothetical protein AUH84_00195 [Thaumarchaeota archaeon 13_1_40CM_4_38_7]|nr:MAG: hypothetical protein AUH84_00195 [Thaumarchaeota archaeon 13_1_40CM_4_38_7]
MRYRSRAEITAVILQSAAGGATKTRLMYKAFLSYAQIKEYLRFLVENGFVKYEEGTQLYKVTPRGRQFLRINEEINELVNPGHNEKLKTIEF